jgi:hypothetical protein
MTAHGDAAEQPKQSTCRANRHPGGALTSCGLSPKMRRIAMKAALLFVVGLAGAILSTALFICGLTGPAMSQTVIPPASGATALPSAVVQAPKRVVTRQKPKQSAVSRDTVSPRTSQTTETPAAPESVSAKLDKLAKATGSCVGGGVTSFRYGDAPWHGCSTSGWPALSPTCRNVGNYKTYAECTEAGLLTGWRPNEIPWYCSSLALK